MVLFISGQVEKDIVRKALCNYIAQHESEHAVKLLARVVKCVELQDRQQTKKKAATPKSSD